MNTKLPIAVGIAAAIAAALFLSVGMVSAAGPICSVPGDYAIIQDAVNDVGCTTINVAAGTYVENLTLGRDITLNGAQAGVDARGRVAAETIIAPAAGVGLTLVTGSAGATIDGFTISGGTRGIESGSDSLNGLSILNNRIIAFSNGGIFLNDNGTDMTVDKNAIDASSKTGGGGIVHMDTDAMDGFWFTNNDVVNGNVAGTGTGLFSDSNRNVGVSGTRSPKMSGNLFQAHTTGVNLGSRSWEFADISNNTFKNNTFDGLQGGMATSTIANNLFENNGRSGLALTSFGNVTVGRGALANTITLNTFTSNDTEAIFLSIGQSAGSISTNVVNRNSISGNAFGLRYGGTEAINAECNWWGSASGPGPVGPGSGDNVGASATIDYTSWLTTSDLVNDPCTGVPPPPVTVTIIKYIDGVHATAANANSASFPMAACWDATNIGAGCGNFALSTGGFNNPNPYEATTASMTNGADYSTNEETSGPNVGASCSEGKPFALAGYKTGDTEALAAAAALSPTSPALTNVTADKFTIVWNIDCAAELTLQKTVINDSGGLAADTNWTLAASGPTPISGVEGNASVTSATVNAGTYDLSESGGPATYTASAWACVGGTQTDGDTVDLAPGDDVTCTITNNDNPGVLVVKKVLINDNGGSSATTTFKFKVNGGTAQAFQADGQNDINSLPGAYSVVENAALGYITTYSNSQNANADCNALNVAQGQTVTCTITNNDVPPPPANACTLGSVPGYTLQNGTPASNVVTLAPFTMFKGNGGNDIVTAGAKGNYIICTLGGNDVITMGSAGAVTIDAGNGRNTLTLGSATGFVTTGTGDDLIMAGNGARTINAGNGKNTITTGSGNQTITTGSGDDFITTSGGSDTINAGAGKNKVLSGGGSDSLTALGGNDFFEAGAGADTCSPGGGVNIVINCSP